MLLYGQQYPAGIGVSTVLAGGDYETYSEAGYRFHPEQGKFGKWKIAKKNVKSGLSVVGAWEYSRHESTDVTTFVYDLKDGRSKRLWYPGLLNPQDLFDHIARGGLFEAYNSFFEWCIWNNVCRRRYGWPTLPLEQTRDVQAKSSSWTIPGSLGLVGEALNTTVQKDETGKTVMRKVSKPRTPTIKDKRQRYTRANAPEEFAILDAYCVDDVGTEDCVSLACADLSPFELEVWKLDQQVNARGIAVNRDDIAACISIIEQAEVKYNAEICHITGGVVATADKAPALKKWLRTQGIATDTIEKEWIAQFLERPAGTPVVRRALEIRQILGSKSVQKAYALMHRIGEDGRVRDIIKYCGAGRTWRFAGVGPQPQNLPATGPPVKRCADCKAYRGAHLWFCPQCWGVNVTLDADWDYEAAEECLKSIRTRDLATVETLWGDPLTSVSGCLRSLFVAAEECELICSDYSGIEAVVLAMISGEEWRIEVFRTHGKIYEAGLSKIINIPLQEILDYKERTGNHHPDRKGLGKIPELASGYGGSVGAWRRAFKKAGLPDDFMTDEKILENVQKWRKASPAVVRFWYAIQRAAVNAVENPGRSFEYSSKYATIRFQVWGDVLYCHLPSGRAIPYHSPEISHGYHNGRATKTLSYMGIVGSGENKHWARIETFHGGLTENICQAISRDVFVAALLRLQAAGYPIVLHVHDEWCRDWPIFAKGGYCGSRFRPH